MIRKNPTAVESTGISSKCCTLGTSNWDILIFCRPPHLTFVPTGGTCRRKRALLCLLYLEGKTQHVRNVEGNWLKKGKEKNLCEVEGVSMCIYMNILYIYIHCTCRLLLLTSYECIKRIATSIWNLFVLYPRPSIPKRRSLPGKTLVMWVICLFSKILYGMYDTSKINVYIYISQCKYQCIYQCTYHLYNYMYNKHMHTQTHD